MLFLGLIDLQVRGRPQRRATRSQGPAGPPATDLAEIIGWDRGSRRLLHLRAGHGRGPLYYSLYARVRDVSAEFPDSERGSSRRTQRRHAGRGRGKWSSSSGGGRADDLEPRHRARRHGSRSRASRHDPDRAAELILRTRCRGSSTDAQHPLTIATGELSGCGRAESVSAARALLMATS